MAGPCADCGRVIDDDLHHGVATATNIAPHPFRMLPPDAWPPGGESSWTVTYADPRDQRIAALEAAVVEAREALAVMDHRREVNARVAMERADELIAIEDRIRAELEREYTWVIAALCARSPDRAVTIYFHDVLMLDGAHSAVEKDTTQIDRIVYRLRSR